MDSNTVALVAGLIFGVIIGAPMAELYYKEQIRVRDQLLKRILLNPYRTTSPDWDDAVYALLRKNKSL